MVLEVVFLISHLLHRSKFAFICEGNHIPVVPVAKKYTFILSYLMHCRHNVLDC